MSFTRSALARSMAVGLAAAALPVGLVASPASATVAYGYIQGNSSCPVAPANASCNVYIKYGSTITTTHPKSGGDVNYCGAGVPNGSPIYSEINSGEIDNRYVAVIWNQGLGVINCH